MTSTPSALTLRNLAGQAVRLHFCCDGRQAWEAWGAAGGELVVPEALPSRLLASVSYVDPHTRVAYALPQRPAPAGMRLVASVRNVAGARSVDCETQAGSASQLLEMVNRTDGDVCFMLAFAGTPFVVHCPLRPGAAAHFHPRRFELSATLGGVSCAAMPVAAWNTLVEISARKMNGIESPHFRPMPGDAGSGA
jgi:hypothetical protein